MKQVKLLALLLLFLLPAAASAQVISTIAGTDSAGFGGDNGAATSAKLNSPHDVVAMAGNIYFTDQSNNRVRKISPAGIITTIAGTVTAGFFGDNGQATAAELYLPTGLATDNSGNLYIADESNYRIRKISPSGIISTVAGNGVFSYTSDGIQATAAGLFPNAVTVDASGNMYIAELSNNRVRKVNTAGIISTVAGDGTGGFGGDSGLATNAKLSPNGVAVDAAGNIYISDVFNNRIRKVNTSGIISTYVGNGAAAYGGDGGPCTADSVSLQAPQCVRFDSLGNLFIADNFNNRVRKINTSGIITTVAGDGTAGFSGDNGLATAAELNAPSGVCTDGNGRLYIADNFNNRIRRSAPPALKPIIGSTTICSGLAIIFSDSTAGGTWSSSSTAVATVGSSTGVVTGHSAGIVTITYTLADSFVTTAVTVYNCPFGVENIRGAVDGIVSVYPNPCSGSFTLSYATAQSEPIEISITNLLGQQIKTLNCFSNKEETINLGSLPGVYLLNVVTPQGTQRIKLVVE